MSLLDSGNEPDNTNPGEGGGSPSDSPDMGNAPQWLTGIEGVDPELVNDPSLKAINNPADLVKSYVNAQKMIGKDKVILPTEKSSEVEWETFWRKMGKPETAEDYKFELGEQVSFDENFVGKFAELAHKYNVLPHQAQALIKELNEYEYSLDQNYQQEVTQKVEQAKQQLQSEWGDSYQSNINKAANVIKEFGGPEDFEYFNQAGYGSDPKFLQFLVKVAGGAMGEDSVTPNTPSGGMSMDEVNRKINEAYSDPAYLNSHHVDHKRKVEEVQKLFKLKEKYTQQKQPVGF